jgi:hypothetical protein
MVKYKCKMAGKVVKDKANPEIEYACAHCNGIFEVEVIGKTVDGRDVLIKKPPRVIGMFAPPRAPDVGFDCPYTIPNPTASDYVEVIES